MPDNPQSPIEQWWEDFQNWLASSRANIQSNMQALGMTRQQQQNSPASQWNMPQQQLTYDKMRPWMGDNAVNAMQNVADWYQNKAIPFWQRLTTPGK